jgi:Transglycosylase SLT domain
MAYNPNQWSQHVTRFSKQYGVNPEFAMAILRQESGGNPNARSPAGAMGLMQLMPQTAAGLGVKNAFDPIQNIEGGVKYLRQQLQQFKGDERWAAAAYNAGPGAVQKYHGIPPYRETQNYVQKVMANMGKKSLIGTTVSGMGGHNWPSVPPVTAMSSLPTTFAPSVNPTAVTQQVFARPMNQGKPLTNIPNLPKANPRMNVDAQKAAEAYRDLNTLTQRFTPSVVPQGGFQRIGAYLNRNTIRNVPDPTGMALVGVDVSGKPILDPSAAEAAIRNQTRPDFGDVGKGALAGTLLLPGIGTAIGAGLGGLSAFIKRNKAAKELGQAYAMNNERIQDATGSLANKVTVDADLANRSFAQADRAGVADGRGTYQNVVEKGGILDANAYRSGVEKSSEAAITAQADGIKLRRAQLQNVLSTTDDPVLRNTVLKQIDTLNTQLGALGVQPTDSAQAVAAETKRLSDESLAQADILAKAAGNQYAADTTLAGTQRTAESSENVANTQANQAVSVAGIGAAVEKDKVALARESQVFDQEMKRLASTYANMANEQKLQLFKVTKKIGVVPEFSRMSELQLQQDPRIKQAAAKTNLRLEVVAAHFRSVSGKSPSILAKWLDNFNTFMSSTMGQNVVTPPSAGVPGSWVYNSFGMPTNGAGFWGQP